MSIAALLVASALLTQTGGAPQGHGTVTLAGKVISVQYPSAGIRQVPDEVKSWDGFGGISGASVDWPTPFAETNYWKPLADRLAAIAGTKVVRTIRVKAVLLTSGDYLDSRAGILGQSRSRLTDSQVDAVLRALARVPGYVRAETDGALDTQLDLTIESEPILFNGSQPEEAWVRSYMAPRFNRGTFEADDKEFRGPYDAVVLLHPGYDADQKVVNVGGQAVAVASVYNAWSGAGEANGIEDSMSWALAACAVSKMGSWGVYHPSQSGGQGVTQPDLLGLYSPEQWSILLGGTSPSLGDLKTLYTLASKEESREVWNAGEVSRASAWTPNISLTVVDDAQRGKVLRYAESAPARRGGFALPYKNVDLSQTSKLSFMVKSDSADPIELRYGDGRSMAAYNHSYAFTVPNDKAWHQVTVDLGSSGKVGEFLLGPASESQRNERRDFGEVVYYFDDFKLTSEGEGTPANIKVLPEVERAKVAITISAADLAKEPSDLVRLNGLSGRTGFGSADEAPLIELAKSPNARIAALAVKALGQIDSPTAKAEILRLATASPFEPVRQAAALEIGRIGDPKTAGPLSRLYANRSWQTRLAGARALTMIPGDEAAVISMTFMQEIDPQIRTELTERANIQNAVVIKRLLWSAVNDPSDSVRAASCWKLTQSGRPRDVIEGYKGVRDDSLGVRVELLQRMIAMPSDTHRGAIRVAVTDSSPVVRALALEAFSKLPGEVQTEEFANVLEDKYPVVQMALLDLAKAKKIVLPANALASLKASMDPRVVQRAQEIGQ